MFLKKIKASVLLPVLALNLLVSGYSLGLAADVTGSVAIVSCVVDCLTMLPPLQISRENPKFTSSSGDRLAIVFNYPLGQALSIADIRSDGGFEVEIEITDLVHKEKAGYTIPHTAIGILSFNNNPDENITLDSTNPYPEVVSHIAQKLSYNQVRDNAETYSDDYYHFFPEIGSLPLISAPHNPTGYHDTFSMGLAFVFKTPPNPEQTMIDGEYFTTVTYTITAN